MTFKGKKPFSEIWFENKEDFFFFLFKLYGKIIFHRIDKTSGPTARLPPSRHTHTQRRIGIVPTKIYMAEPMIVTLIFSKVKGRRSRLEPRPNEIVLN